MKQVYSVKDKTEYTFESYVSKTKVQIELELEKFTSGLAGRNLHAQIEYAILSEGKRLRPLLTIISAESVGGNRNNVMPLALALELIHTATLVHDDIIDQDDTRRGMPALHRKWSVNDAILTGDALIALAVDLASSYDETVLKTVARSALELCDGERMDIAFSLKTLSESSYFKKIKEKSASLFAAATYCGALAGGGTVEQVHSLSEFGENFGLAYQLRDDLLDLTRKQNRVSKDLRSGRITLPLIHLYAQSSFKDRKQMEKNLKMLQNSNPKVNNEHAKKMLQSLQSAGSIDYCEKKIDEHLKQAVASLSTLKDSGYKTYLVEMTEALRKWG